MASFGNQPTWVPYEPSKDCSQGFCSIYCPQWCYIVFPPPPPFELSEEDSGPTFSPLVIAIIGILASAFLLVTYYTIMSKYCSSFDSLRRRILGPGTSDREPDFNLGQSHRQETWQVSPSNGIEEALINKIAVCKYRKGDGLVDGTDCSVCLSEFRDDESLRLLPKCSHAFHVQCIDTWLKSHSTCPLCRANIVSANTPPPPQLPPPPPEQDSSSTVGGEMVVVVEDLESGVEEETHLVNDDDEPKSERIEEANAITEIRDGGIQPIRRSFSVDSQIFRLSIADVLQISMEDELLAAKEHGLLGGVGGSERRWPGEHSKDSSRSRALHCVMSPVTMKRSFSSGRFCFSGYGRGRNPLLPI